MIKILFDIVSHYGVYLNSSDLHKENIMEKREVNISFYKAGNGESSRLNIPRPWLSKLNITKEEKEIDLIFDEENQQIVIRKRK